MAKQKQKYKPEPINHDDTKARGVFFRNYDLYDTGGPGPGTGLYQHMDEYESVADFRKKKKKENERKKRMALFESFMSTTTKPQTIRSEKIAKILNMVDIFVKSASDCNCLDFAHEEHDTQLPFNPAVPAPLGLIDSMYPEEDLEGKPVTNLYYGRLETHEADDKKK